MKATLKQISEAVGPLNALVGAKIPAKAAYAVSKLAKACATEMEHFGKQRDKVFEDFGCVSSKVSEDRIEWNHPEGKEKLLEAVKQIEDMLTSETELNALPLDLDQFGDAELPGGSFFGLDWAMKS